MDQLPQLLEPITENLFFKGRPGDPRLGDLVKRGMGGDIILYGCPDDTGVLLNRGRPGAKEGPNSIRKHLYRLTPPLSLPVGELSFEDAGNLVPSTDIMETQERCHRAVSQFPIGSTLIALGGGHDFAAPNFLGFAARHPKSRLGLINIDPHLDVRELENGKAHSGTPFRQILDSGTLLGRNFIEFGFRENRNAKTHYTYCETHGAKLLSFEEIRKMNSVALFKRQLELLARSTDQIMGTIDMDSCEEAEGVSAAAVVGFSAWELCQFARLMGENSKVRLLEIAEVAPPLDPTERSSRIAAEVVSSFLCGRASTAIAKSPKSSKRSRKK